MLVSLGNTRVLTNATIEPGVPGWLRNSGRGWVTAEYAMLPRSTVTRTPRESERGKIGGRTHEIQRLIGRSLRSVVDMKALGERTVILDCDVIQADGGTRTAAITGAAVALALALNALVEAGTLKARRCSNWWPPPRWAWWAARRCSTSATRRTRRPRWT